MTVIDEFNREIITVDVGHRINSSKLLQILNRLKHEIGLPEIICSDNGREFTSVKVQQWAKDNNVRWLFLVFTENLYF